MKPSEFRVESNKIAKEKKKNRIESAGRSA
jgi:hypothetical protein